MPSQTQIPNPGVATGLLKGKLLRVPDLHPVFAQWPAGISPHLPEVRRNVNQVVEQFVHDEEARNKIYKTDVSLMIARYVTSYLCISALL